MGKRRVCAELTAERGLKFNISERLVSRPRSHLGGSVFADFLGEWSWRCVVGCQHALLSFTGADQPVHISDGFRNGAPDG